MTVLLVNLLAKRDIVSKNESKKGNSQFWVESCDSNIFANRCNFKLIYPRYKSYMPVLVSNYFVLTAY
jgi:hypothetical protein